MKSEWIYNCKFTIYSMDPGSPFETPLDRPYKKICTNHREEEASV